MKYFEMPAHGFSTSVSWKSCILRLDSNNKNVRYLVNYLVLTSRLSVKYVQCLNEMLTHRLLFKRELSKVAELLCNSVRNACGKTTTDAATSFERKVSPVSYCIDQVRKFDRDNYLATIFINDLKTKRIVFALRAFNVELSLVRDSTTNSDRAKLRLHFWSKLIEEIVRRNDRLDSNSDKLNAYYHYAPVAKELLDLFDLIEMDEMMKRRLNDLIGARVSSKVLGYKPFETMDELELYCCKSNSSIYHLAWSMSQQIHSVWNSPDDLITLLERISEKLGVAHGLSNVIRGISYNSKKNCCYVPKDVLEEFKLTNRDFIGKNFDAEKISLAVKKLALRCQTLLNEAYSDHSLVPNHFRQIFLPRVAIQDSLNRLKKCNYNLSNPALSVRNGLLPFDFWMASKYFRAPIL